MKASVICKMNLDQQEGILAFCQSVIPEVELLAVNQYVTSHPEHSHCFLTINSINVWGVNIRCNQIHLKWTEDTDVLCLNKSEIRVFFLNVILLHWKGVFNTLRTRCDVRLTFQVLKQKQNKTNNGMYYFCNTLLISHFILRLLNFATFAIWEKSWNLTLAKSKIPKHSLKILKNREIKYSRNNWLTIFREIKRKIRYFIWLNGQISVLDSYDHYIREPSDVFSVC